MSKDPMSDSDKPQLLGEISQGPSALEQFLDRNQKNLVILTILVTIGVAAFVVWKQLGTSKERQAGAAFCTAADMPALQAVIKDFPGTAAAATAEVSLAERQWTDGQQATAIQTLRDFIAANPKHTSVFAAKASLAGKLRTQEGKGGEAAALYKELVDESGSLYLATYSLVCLGDIAKDAGNTDEAASYYQRAKTTNPTSAFNQTVDQRIANLKTLAPVEIAAPPAPPAPVPPAPGAPDNDVPKLDITNPGGAPAPVPTP